MKKELSFSYLVGNKNDLPNRQIPFDQA